MASRATGILKAFDDRLPAPLARKFGTPAAAAWTAAFVLIAAFGVINYGVGLLLDTVLHPAPEEASAPAEPAGEPASVVVDLPPPLVPRVAAAPVAAAVPAAVAPTSPPQRSTRWDSRRYRHGWGSRRGHDTASEPAEATMAPVPAANHNPSPTGLLSGGLPKRVSGSGESPVRKEAAIVTAAVAKPAAPATAAPKAGPPAAPPSSSPN